MNDAARPFVVHRYAIRADGSAERLADLAYPMFLVTTREGFLEQVNEWNGEALSEWNRIGYRILYVAA